jgi:hypothetical protein
MDDEERRKKYEEQTDELYAAIGRFTVKFEHVCHAMSSGILTMLELAGLRNQRIGQAVLAGLTAEPLKTMFRAVLTEYCKDQLDDAEQKIIADVMKRVGGLIESRNNIIHRTWFVGWASESQEDFSTVAGIKTINTARGIEFRSLNWNEAEFDQLSEEADELTKLVNRLWGTAYMKIFKSSKFTDNFIRDAAGTVRVPPGC